MSTARSPIRSIVRATTTVRRPHSRISGVDHDVDEALDEPPVRAVDELVELDEALRARDVALAERVQRDAHHLLGALAHLRKDVGESGIRLDIGDELRELRDRHAAVARALEQEVDVDHRQQEPQIAGHRRLQGEQRLDLLLDREEMAVDLVIERDHLVGKLAVALLKRARRAVDGAQDALPHLLQLGLDLPECVVHRHTPSVLLPCAVRAERCHHSVSNAATNA